MTETVAAPPPADDSLEEVSADIVGDTLISGVLDEDGAEFFDREDEARVVCATGTIGGRPVAIYSIETGHHEGVIGIAESAAIVGIGEFARAKGMPLVSINAALAPVMAEGLNAVEACERVARQSIRLRSDIAQVAIVTDEHCAAHGYLAAYADLFIMTEGAFAATDSAHCVEPDFHSTFGRARQLVQLLPATTATLQDALTFVSDGGDRELSEDLCSKLGVEAAFDVLELITEVCDSGSFVELDAGRGPAMVTGLGAIYEQTVGICANQTFGSAGLDSAAIEKAAELTSLCDRFGIPLLNIVDNGEAATERAVLHPDGTEKPSRTSMNMRRGAQLMLARTTMGPCMSLIVRRCYGPGYLLSAAARPHHPVIAYTDAQLGPDGSECAADAAFARGMLKKVIKPEQTVEQLVHWSRWSRAQRSRVTDQLHKNDPKRHNLNLDKSS